MFNKKNCELRPFRKYQKLNCIKIKAYMFELNPINTVKLYFLLWGL